MIDEQSQDEGDSGAVEDALGLQKTLHAYTGRLMDYLARRVPAELRGVVDAQDIIQDTFFAAFQRVSEFEPQGEDAMFRWLVMIAKNRLVEVIRMHKSLKRGGGRERIEDDVDGVISVLEELAVYSRTPSQSAMSHEAVSIVQSSISRIEPDYQQVIRLRYIEGLSARQSAERMGRTEGAIFMLANRALKALQEQLILTPLPA